MVEILFFLKKYMGDVVMKLEFRQCAVSNTNCEERASFA